jgi:S1-C subfamily serine protease
MRLRRYISIGLFSVWSLSANAQPVKNRSSLELDVLSIASHVEKARSSLVSIQSFVYENDGMIQRIGSGFIYNEMGFVVTLGSVIQGGDSIMVTTEDGRKYSSDIVHYDESTDIILLKLAYNPVSFLELGNSFAMVPQSALVVLGNSLGVFPSVTLGTYLGKTPDGLLRLTIMAPPGNSGSPVMNRSGQVVGIFIRRILRDSEAMTGLSGEGIAMPIERVDDVIDPVLKSFQEGSGWIGITVKDLIDTAGVRVIKVVPRGPAYQAGISKGDTLIGFEGRAVENQDQLAEWVRQASPDTKMALTVHRNKMDITHLVRVQSMPGIKKRHR